MRPWSKGLAVYKQGFMSNQPEETPKARQGPVIILCKTCRSKSSGCRPTKSVKCFYFLSANKLEQHFNRMLCYPSKGHGVIKYV